jgi:cellulose synthase/poly-beta-1,6-N-acetylglucosamine synthase-like glycosyltransferase
MATTAIVLVSVAAIVLAYVSVGYPLLLKGLVSMRGARPVRREAITPKVSLVISAYNEAPVIAAKIENALALDYPAGLLEIAVISDESTDGTDRVVAGFAGRGVLLFRQSPRRGKTAGLNRTMAKLSGDIVVFSDANAMYERGAIRALVRNFADPAVGCVTGEARYSTEGAAAAEAGERLYWNYEMQIKRLETALGSMVGGDGAIYAIRRALWQDLPENAINDFLNPLQIVAAGWRAVYEPDAVCYEDPGGSARSEYRRRVRIVSRSWRAVFQARQVLNPFRVGLFAWSVVSHKVLRWMAGLFAALGLVGGLLIAAGFVRDEPRLAAGVATLVAILALTLPKARKAAAMAWYFAVINVASFVGLIKGTFGRVSGTWSTPRADGADAAGPVPATVPVGLLFLGGCSIALIGGLAWWPVVGLWRGAAFAFWGCLGVLGYVFVGYPIILALARFGGRRNVAKGGGEPRVCLFITANDEARVMDAKLQNALALAYPQDRLDIVVASDGSVDGTNEIVRRFAPRVRLLEFAPRRGKIAAINDGMRAVTSEIVVFSDANTFCDPRAIRALVSNFADRSVGAVSGDVVLTGDRASLARSEDLYYRYERWVQRAESELGSMIGVDGALYAVRRELFVPPAADTILDDMAIPMAVIRSGRRVVFEPDAIAHEQGCETAREEFSRKSRVIAGAVQFLGRGDSAVPFARPQVMFSLVSHKALRWLTPLFALGAFFTSIALAGSTSTYAAAAIGQAVLLAVGLAGCSPTLRRAAVVAIPHYFFLVQAAAAVGLVRGLVRRQSVLWRRFDRVPVS